jgi:hypothetical protein
LAGRNSPVLAHHTHYQSALHSIDRTPRDWTPLSYAKAKGKYGATEEKGIYPEDVLLYYGATEYGSGPPALGSRSPRQSFNPEDDKFMRERGSYQTPFAEP